LQNICCFVDRTFQNYKLLHDISFSFRCKFLCYILYYSLSQLTQLEILDIGMNTLNTVPEVVSSLTSLKQLNVENCCGFGLPDRFVCHMFITTSQLHYYLNLIYICTQLIVGSFYLI